MLNVKEIFTNLKLQRRIGQTKFISSALPLNNTLIKTPQTSFKKRNNFGIYRNNRNIQENQEEIAPGLMQLITFNEKLHNREFFLSKILKAILNIYRSKLITTIKPYRNQIKQNQRLHHNIKASMITNEFAATYNLLICQNNVDTNTSKFSRYFDSDFFTLKAESCANLLSNFITEFINNINCFQNYFSFNLNIVLNGNNRENLEKDPAIILAENINNSRNINKIYSANIFGANLISKCLRFNKNIVNFFKGDSNSKSLNIKNMSKVATEKPPIDISKGNTNNTNSKETSLSIDQDMSTSSSTSSGNNTNNGNSNLEKPEKGSCFTASLGDIIKFLELVGGLKHTKRTGFVLRDVKNCESISGHMYRMAMMTFLLDGTEGLNQTKCMELALVHDLAECIVGDLTPFCGVTKEDKKRMEMEAMEKICKLIEPRGKRMWELFVEYESGESPESKFVKDLDRLDMVLQAFEYEKRDNCLMKHQEFFDSTDGKFEHSFVKKLVKEIYDQRNKLANETGCTPDMYPQPTFLHQNGHHQNGLSNVVNGEIQTPVLTTSSTTNSSSSPTTSSSTTTDLDQQKATNGR
ncbi:myb-like protein D [Condylostylus longicornis]|uniref:myb-like protein D n=1 Tax=Condylostylus longicornis TaxID=2530218 RepID=UPI00244E2EE7|nr:myb-like protein D [Condylostylus longicornis]